MRQIEAHGGELVNRLVEGMLRQELADKASSLFQVSLSPREICDLEQIAIGAFSPIKGFMNKEDYHSVIDNKRLADGTVWTLPVTLSVEKEIASRVKVGQQVALRDPQQERVLAVLTVEEIFPQDRQKEAMQVYGTDSAEHPGVLKVLEMPGTLLAGPVEVLELPKYAQFGEYRLAPFQTRQLFADRGWKQVVGFQTRNPIHRAHEYLTKCALESCDGLLIHPLVGETKSDDIPADVRMRCYEVLIENYYPKDRVVLSIWNAAMRYAGPREAVFHALVRKNYGCSHFIVGRDHAGVGSFYGSFDAHYIFDEFEPEELGIRPLLFDHTFFCKRTGGMASFKTSPAPEDRIMLSGTKVRELLSNGEIPPPEFTRPEVAKVLIDAYSQPRYEI
ncbi:MAG: sulfate adenylyltransferase [Candidatus Omnitrophica bacterium]|nr:sulfate adenylyltransferase [Candidatus Omnitrophota bacterium]